MPLRRNPSHRWFMRGIGGAFLPRTWEGSAIIGLAVLVIVGLIAVLG